MIQEKLVEHLRALRVSKKTPEDIFINAKEALQLLGYTEEQAIKTAQEFTEKLKNEKKEEK